MSEKEHVAEVKIWFWIDPEDTDAHMHLEEMLAAIGADVSNEITKIELVEDE